MQCATEHYCRQRHDARSVGLQQVLEKLLQRYGIVVFRIVGDVKRGFENGRKRILLKLQLCKFLYINGLDGRGGGIRTPDPLLPKNSHTY